MNSRPLLVGCLCLLAAASLSAQKNFTGRWSTVFGPMQLTQKGKRVTGHYGYGKTKVKGTVQRRQLTFDYGSGEATFELWKDGQFFSGKYTASNGRQGTWGGYRLNPTVAKARPGRIVLGQAKSGLRYHLHVPKGFSRSKKYPAIVILHGSNMTAEAYVNTIVKVWPRLAREYIVLGFDGENLSRGARPGRLAFNYSYVNFSGHGKGPLAAQRQSPALVAEALDELKTQFPIDRYFVGGHSQGGFLTYAVAMFYPEKVAGVFPMSCNLLVQCEPDYHTDAKLRARQRAVPIAVVHGENDPVVKFSGGEWCYRAMIDGGFPFVHFFVHKTAAHMFAHLPVADAVRWLDAASSDDATMLLEFADTQLKNEAWRDAAAAVHRIRAAGVPSDLKFNVKRIAAKVDAKAKAEATRLLGLIRKNRNNGWVDDFLVFREKFAHADCAEPVMQAYAKLRKRHEKPANTLFYAARGLRDAAEREAKYREILDEYYASKWYAHVRGWVDD